MEKEQKNLNNLIEILDTSDRIFTEKNPSLSHGFREEAGSILREDLSEERATKLFDLYKRKLSEYDDSGSKQILLESYVALFNSVLQFEDDDSIELQKMRLWNLVGELNKLEDSEEFKEDFLLLKVKTLLQYTVNLTENDHNFERSLEHLEEIKKINEEHDVLHGKVWDVFVISLLQVYGRQDETEKREKLIEEVINNIDQINCYRRWDIVLQLVRFNNISDETFKYLAKVMLDYFFNWKNSAEESEQVEIQKCYNEMSKAFLIERLTSMAKDSQRDEGIYNNLINNFNEKYKDVHARESLAEIYVTKGITNNDSELTQNGISQYEELEEEGYRGIEFHSAEARIKYHLKFTDFNTEDGVAAAKKDLFNSLGIIERSLGERLIEIFTRMINSPDINLAYFREKLDTYVSEEDKEELTESLNKIKQSAYLRDVATLIVLLYKDKADNPLAILKTAIFEQEKFYKERKKIEFEEIESKKEGSSIKDVLEDYYDIEITHFYPENILENEVDDFFEKFALKIKNDDANGYLVHREEINHEVAVFIGFSTPKGIFILEKKGKYLKSHAINFIRSELAEDELKIENITHSKITHVKVTNELTKSGINSAATSYACSLGVPLCLDFQRGIELFSKNDKPLGSGVVAQMKEVSGPPIMAYWPKGILTKVLLSQGIDINECAEIGTLNIDRQFIGTMRSDILKLLYYCMGRITEDLGYEYAIFLAHKAVIQPYRKDKVPYDKLTLPNNTKPLTEEEAGNRFVEELGKTEKEFDLWERYRNLKPQIYLVKTADIIKVWEPIVREVIKKHNIEIPFDFNK